MALRNFLKILCSFTVFSIFCGIGIAETNNTTAADTKIILHEHFVKAIEHQRSADISFEHMADVLFKMLPDKITVYPSEGYYYFQFFMNGENVRGNIRFDLRFAEQGKLPIIFYEMKSSGEEENERYKVMEKSANFSITKRDRLNYSISYKGRTISANLYDLKPDMASFGLASDSEDYIGPIYDDSAVKFDLIYHRKANVFVYLLNERGAAFETYRTLTGSSNILIGNRTGFAYYVEPDGRKILVGLSKKESEENSFYDGPFDQFPDTVLDGEKLKAALETFEPRLKGIILPGGWYIDDIGSRYSIFPFMLYTSEAELFRAASCGLNVDLLKRYSCLGHLDKE